MNKKLRELIDRFIEIFDRRSEEFIYKTYVGDELDVDQYCDEAIPIERVIDDFNKMVSILYEGKDTLEKDDFYILVATFCNYYIGEGFNVVLKKEKYFGLNPFFTYYDKRDIVYCIFKGITTQNYNWFKYAYDTDNTCTVAKVYLFVNSLTELTNAIVSNNDISEEFENSVWKYYEELEEYWREYVLTGSQEYILNGTDDWMKDKSPLPYICYISYKKKMVQNITVSLNAILDKLGYDIDKIELRDLYILVLDALCNAKEELVNFTFWIQSLFASAGELLKISKDEMSNINKFERFQYLYDKLYKVYRFEFLHIRFIQNELISRKFILNRYKIFVQNRELRKKNEELEKRNAEIEQLNIEREGMMNYYAHSWKHIAYPEIVKSVAEELMSRDISLASRLIKAYNSEKTLQHGIQLLQLINSGNKQAIKNKFEEGFARFGRDASNVINIRTLIEQSLDIVVFKILMKDSDDSTAIQQCRGQVGNYSSLKSCIDAYTSIFIEKCLGENINIVDWVSDNIIKIKILIDEEWTGIRVKKGSFGASTLIEIFVEVFTNAFMHGKEYLELNLISSNNCLEINSLNKIGVTNPGTGQGLVNIKKLMDKINMDTDTVGLNAVVKDDEYSMCIRILKELMIIRGR
jgi:hypothetical protein